jgi:glutamyl-tRNA reductase
MPVVVVGLNHQVAPVEVRERVAFAPHQMEAAHRALRQRVQEGVILSTCNRVEVCAVVDRAAAGVRSVGSFLGRFHDCPPPSLTPYLYHLEGTEAVAHLFAVAAGLDSSILGEPQILGQVRTAYQTAASYRATGPILSWIFQHALKVGKQVRSDTDIGRNAGSVPHAAVELARKTLGSLEGCSALVVGAGSMGELAAKALRFHKLSQFVVANRTYPRAVALAERVGGRAVEFARLPELVAEADVILTSTGSPDYILTKSLVERATRGRSHPLLISDIAVPRDVDPAVREIDGVFLHDVDDLEAVCTANLEEQRKEVAQAQEIIEAEVAAFQAWWETRDVVPTIAALYQKAEEIRQAELRKTLSHLGEISERERTAFEALAHAIVNKLLHEPVSQLKTENGNVSENVQAMRRLFMLDPQC